MRKVLAGTAIAAVCGVIAPPAALAADTLAVGRGEVVDTAPPDGDTYSFSFLARAKGGLATGSYTLTNAARGFSLAGDVNCLSVSGDDAVLSGRITRQTGVGPGDGGVGDTFLVFIGDAGGPNTTFTPFTVAGDLPGLCLTATSAGGLPLLRGGIVVKG